MSSSHLQIGGRVIELATAESWIDHYFDQEKNTTSRRPYAYPAYDKLATGSGPDELNDGDLLAPALLNAAPSITAFYALQSVRQRLVAALAATPTGLTVHDALADGSLRERLSTFVSILDTSRLRGVRLTLLTKVLYRKRPLLLPLHDQFIHACYVGDDGYPVPRIHDRSWVDYYTAITRGIAADLAGQHETWDYLAGVAPSGIPELRLLDVVAWNLGRHGGREGETTL